ncbi:hypothetical protein ASZ78_008858 [Callipepla squamata]|uniref:Potassium channel domain-containing protein n=1 Tax=Callipepla squamata TaxID=9009 RepID=A0A226NE24_CALSU|nr:hypothetical protein ASZ78_008858 [Callipepla squamata]
MSADPQPAVRVRLSYRRRKPSSRIPPGSVRLRGEGGGRGGAGRAQPPPAPASSAPREAAVSAAAMGMAVGRRGRWSWRVPVLLLAYLVYVGLGAGVLQALERPAEVRTARRLLQQRWELLANHSCLQGPTLQRLIQLGAGGEKDEGEGISCAWWWLESLSCNLDFTSQLWKCQLCEVAMTEFVGSHVIVSLQGIIEAYKSGVTIQGNSTSLGRWDFSGSFFFSISAITTIGYGNLSPSTVAGRIFCILFALFGIPLNLVLLNEIGQLMLLGVQRSAHHLEEKFHWKIKAALVMKTCALVTGLLLFLLLPPLLFSSKEGWTYEEGFYYSFITLSTIGFGDYVIGMNPDRTYPNWYKNVISVWILFGMAWLALIIKFCINLLESSSDFCQCNRKSIESSENIMDDSKKVMTGLHSVDSCNDKDTKAGGTGGCHTHTASTEAL